MRNGKTRGRANWGLLAALCLGMATLTGCDPTDDDDATQGPAGRQGAAGATGDKGEPGLTYLTATVAADPGDCPTGGVALQVGPDTNRNGLLDADEVTASTPVCHGAEGAPPLAGVNANITTTPPANGTHYVAGEPITIRVEVVDNSGNPMSEADLRALELRMNGPRTNVNATRIPVGLIRASYNLNGTVAGANVNFLAGTPPEGLNHLPGSNVWIYTTAAVGGEAPGTYTVAVIASGQLDGDGVLRAQDFELHDVQIKTPDPEPLTVERFKCAACHLGANNGKFYLHHIDTGNVAGNNTWVRDSNPVRNCKNCHNNDAVAGYNVCAVEGTEGDFVMRDTDISARNRAGGCPTGYVQTRRADNIVNRVHGIHMGQDRRGAQVAVDGSSVNGEWKPRNTSQKRGLQNPRNVAYPGSNLWDANNVDLDGNVHATGDFRNFAAVGFPSDVRNCEKCHADDSWKTRPSRLACGTCHDNVNFSAPGGFLDRADFVPRYGKCDDGGGFTVGNDGRPICDGIGATYAGEIAHPGGQQVTDDACAGCHPATGIQLADNSAPAPIPAVHAIPDKSGKFVVEANWTNLPGTGFYAAGDAPVLQVVIKDAATDTPVDHTQITQAGGWLVNAWLNGPRAKKFPVLSSAARADITADVAGPYDFGDGGNLVIEIDGGSNDAAGVGSSEGVTATVALAGSMSAAEVVTALNTNATFASKAVAYTLDADTGNAVDADVVKIRSKPHKGYSGLKVLDGAVAQVLFDNGSDIDVFNDVGKQYDLFTGSITSANPTTRSGSGSYSEFQLHLRSATNGVRDPKLTQTAGYLEYRFDTIDASIPAGTYTLALTVSDGTTPITYESSLVQIGTATEEKLIASNCKSCHDFDKRWHENNNSAPSAVNQGYPFSTNFCGSCHDYKQQRGGINPANNLPYGWLAVAGESAGQNWGFGAQPHSKRLHGLHFGNYLDKPDEVHNGYQVEKVIYPVDVRNCEKCHATGDSKFSSGNQYNVMGNQKGVRDANATVLASWANGPFQAGKAGTAAQVEAGTADFEITSGSNVTNPGRIACNGCHDSDAAIAHTALQTYDPTPENPYSGDEQESCATCHGTGRNFAISTHVMNVSGPFQFPYARAPSWMQ
ncbi:MAG: hypothetical protein M0R77_11650 [Gammaproteobacteria bacterium]|nr:hypothetical protein [Gammaproteobacteria bacterium]